MFILLINTSLNVLFRTSLFKLFKLADRLHNIQTIEYHQDWKQEKIANESIILNFENKNYFVNNTSFGEFESLEQFNNVISMSSQTFALNSEFELDIETFLAFDCFLFLNDPSIKPDNLLNIVSYIDKYSEINKKSNLSEYLLFFQNNFDVHKKA